MSIIHPVRLPFVLPVNAEKSVERFINVFIVTGEKVCIIDTGARGCQKGILDKLSELEKTPAEIEWVINTHEHPDHIGGNSFFEKHAGPWFACHEEAVRWIENPDIQYRERPIHGFYSLVKESARITRTLTDGDELDLGDGITLKVIYTPGHSSGSISLFFPVEGVLITGDAIPPVGGLPIYDDAEETRESLQKLAELSGVKTLYCAHSNRPFTGGEVEEVIAAGIDYLDFVESTLAEVMEELPSNAGQEEITREVLLQLDLDPPPVMPITVKSIMSHLK